MLILVLLGLLALPLLTAIEWIGTYSAQIRIESARSAGIRQIAYDTSFQIEPVEEAVALYRAAPADDERLFWDFPSDTTLTDPGGTVIVRGRAGGRESALDRLGLGRNSTYYAKFVILRITFDDGVTLYRWVEVHPERPDDRIAITIPANASN
ncbi:MAG TPA: hypothetical protein VKE40_20660 [Gemmataceae bacterium]|nr:hypothetical protein [Gemmataceae bacterium]